MFGIVLLGTFNSANVFLSGGARMPFMIEIINGVRQGKLKRSADWERDEVANMKNYLPVPGEVSASDVICSF